MYVHKDACNTNLKFASVTSLHKQEVSHACTPLKYIRTKEMTIIATDDMML